MASDAVLSEPIPGGVSDISSGAVLPGGVIGQRICHRMVSSGKLVPDLGNDCDEDSVNKKGVSMKKIRSTILDPSKEDEKGPSRLRVQLDFSADSFERLEELRGETDESSKAEVIRNAIRFYEWLVEQSKAGRFIEVQDDEGRVVTRVEAKWFLR